MRLRLIPKDESFFDLFDQMGQKVEEGAHALLELLENFTDLDRRVGHILDIEHEGDDITHEVLRRLNTTFVTPLDGDDIHRLAANLDHVLDHIEAAADYLQLHKIQEPLPEVAKLARTLALAAQVTAKALPNLRKMNDLENYWVEINRLENDGDRMFRRMIAELYSGEFKAMDVLRWQDIIEEIEGAIDRLEDVANTVEAIYLKQS
jgi:predicted phosphate transport protein (TIGR00153 family)